MGISEKTETSFVKPTHDNLTIGEKEHKDETGKHNAHPITCVETVEMDKDPPTGIDKAKAGKDTNRTGKGHLGHGMAADTKKVEATNNDQ